LFGDEPVRIQSSVLMSRTKQPDTSPMRGGTCLEDDSIASALVALPVLSPAAYWAHERGSDARIADRAAFATHQPTPCRLVWAGDARHDGRHMPRSRDILQRFRSAGTPGAATPTGVPADRVAELSAELEPVLARLAAAQEEAARIRAEAQQEAERRRQSAAEDASALVAAAHRQAAAERADAALRLARRAEQETAATLAAAERDAMTVGRRAAERMPAYVERVVSAVKAALDTAEEHAS
jgi:hypothetical protein